MSSDLKIIRVAVSVPLYRFFDYSLPKDAEFPPVGARVKVNFRQRELVALVVAIDVQSDVSSNKLKPIIECLDKQPVLFDDLQKIIAWMSQYYVAPPGQVADLVLPKKLRLGQSIQPQGETKWQLSEAGKQQPLMSFNHAKVQQSVIKYLQNVGVINHETGKQFGNSWRQTIKTLVKKGFVNESIMPPTLTVQAVNNSQLLKLKPEQQTIVDGIDCHRGFAVHLIHGVTGSGKTEVYLQLVEQVIAQGKQALLLVPEIGLTPQFVARVTSRLAVRVAVVHSGLSDDQRHKAWWFAKTGEADIILGTRASVFTAFKNLGIVIVDEEHDASFKQQDGVRYHARDVGVVRAKELNIPVILGSATPAFETYQNALNKKYKLWEMHERATGMQLPTVEIVDMSEKERDQNLLNTGFSKRLKQAVDERLQKGEQTILYINRRGFAPTLYCPGCAWISTCQRCDARLTHHRGAVDSQQLNVRCHHCGYQARQSKTCPSCQRSELLPVGLGTQRVEDSVQTLFPSASVLRLDRDSVSRKGAFEEKLAEIRNGNIDIILGTQMLSKGHDFPNVTLVGVLNADQGLYSTDFRGPEKMFQQILQVAGRAGRHRPGMVLIQTTFAEHPIFAQLIAQDYCAFVRESLIERRMFSYPPFSNIVLLRAESVIAQEGLSFLRWCRQQCPQVDSVAISDPVAAPMEKRAGRFRAQLLFKSASRSQLHSVLDHLVQKISNSQKQHRIRWSLDVDPAELL